MIDDEIKAVAIIILLTTAAIASYPLLEEGRIIEPFSELGVLGPNMKLGDYPKELVVSKEFNLYLYIGNHEGTSGYFRVVAKIGDQTQNVSDTTPLDQEAAASWETILENESNITIPIKMSISQPGQNKRLVFELWRYNTTAHTFTYHQRWIQLWLNVTTTG